MLWDRLARNQRPSVWDHGFWRRKESDGRTTRIAERLASAATAATVMLDGTPLSPELVLVDPELAERARALLPDRSTDPVLAGTAPRLGGRPPRSVMEHVGASAAAGAAGQRRMRRESLDLPEFEVGRLALAEQLRPLEELAALVDQIATGWRQAEDRLARLERLVERIEGAPAIAAQTQLRPVEAEFRGDADDARLRPADRRPEARARSGVVGSLVFVASIIAAMVAVELLPSSGERPRLAAGSEPAAPSGRNALEQGSDDRPETTAETPVARPRQKRPSAPGPSAGSSKRTVPARPAEPKASSAPPRPTPTSSPSRTPRPKSEAGSGSTTPSAPSGPPTGASSTNDFKPARVFVWPAVEGATTYRVTFFRDGRSFYSAQVSKPRLALPATIRFAPGSYRWVVQPRSGRQALGTPIVDSTFTIEPR